MDIKIILAIVSLFIGLVLFISGMKKNTYRAKGGMKYFAIFSGLILLGYGLFAGMSNLGVYTLPGTAGQIFLSAGVPSGGTTILSGGGSGEANYQPTATYTTKDKFSSSTIAGTSYYKVNGDSATTTAYTNVNEGDSIKYWVDNATTYVQPTTRTAGKGVTIFEAQAWKNATSLPTLSIYDLVGRNSATNGSSNVSLGANAIANIEVSYQGLADYSSAPFGGVMVVEYNATISSVTCTGDSLMSSNPYHLTHTPTYTTHTSKQFAFDSTLDDGSGSIKRITCQFKNSGNAVGNAVETKYFFKFYPANYYLTDNGDFALDVEKYANDDNTLTGYMEVMTEGFWS